MKYINFLQSSLVFCVLIVQASSQYSYWVKGWLMFRELSLSSLFAFVKFFRPFVFKSRMCGGKGPSKETWNVCLVVSSSTQVYHLAK